MYISVVRFLNQGLYEKAREALLSAWAIFDGFEYKAKASAGVAEQASPIAPVLASGLISKKGRAVCICSEAATEDDVFPTDCALVLASQSESRTKTRTKLRNEQKIIYKSRIYLARRAYIACNLFSVYVIIPIIAVLCFIN